MIRYTATTIQQGDALKLMEEIVDESVRLCVTSPPYNIGKEYERDSRRNFSEYISWMDDIIKCIAKKICEGGSFCLQVGSHVSNGVVTPLDYVFYPLVIKAGFEFRNRIIWRYNFGLHSQRRFSGRYETLLWFTKGSDYKFNLDPVRVPQLYPGKRHSGRKGEKAGLPSGNPKGKNPSDFWEFDADRAFFGDPIWNIPNVKSNHPEKTSHPCQFPSELVERCVLALSDPGEVVLDPFAGTGTSVICADAHGRVGVGFDLSQQYVESATERLDLARKGLLPIRKSGQEPRLP